jgi:Protein of unknown function (DUF4019)
MKISIQAPAILLLAAALATAHAQAVPAPSQPSQPATVSPAATGRAIGDSVDQDAVTAATEATDHWLAIVDSGKFGDSWQGTAKVFKLAVTESDWANDLDSIRGKLGKATMRELKTAQFSTTLRGAPSTGEYVTISYLTKFANAPLAMETLVVSKEADGEWRIAGYNIGKAPE